MPEDTDVWITEATTHRCPRCGSHDTRKSLPRGVWDYVVRLFDYWPYRCRKCYFRFDRKLPEPYELEVDAPPPHDS